MKKRRCIVLGDLDDKDIELLGLVSPKGVPLLPLGVDVSSYEEIAFFGGDEVGEELSSLTKGRAKLVSIGISDSFPSVIPDFSILEKEPKKFLVSSSHLYLEARAIERRKTLGREEEAQELSSRFPMPFKELLKEAAHLFSTMGNGIFCEDVTVKIKKEQCTVESGFYILCDERYKDRLSFVGFPFRDEDEDNCVLFVTGSREKALQSQARLVLLVSLFDECVLLKRNILPITEFLLENKGFQNRLKDYVEGGKSLSPAASIHAKKTLALLLSHDPKVGVEREKLALSLGLSSDYLERAFQKTYGLKLWDAISLWRLEKALGFLRQGMPMEEASRRAGFCSQAYFSRVCKRCKGASPRCFLKEEKLAISSQFN